MRRFCAVVGATMVLIASVAAANPPSEARDPFSGRWRLDTQTIGLSNSQLLIALDEKGFGRSTGTAVESKTPADGNFHSAGENGYVDSIAVKIVSDNEVHETNMVKGRLAYESRYLLTENGQVLNWFVTSHANATRTAVKSSTTWRRVEDRLIKGHRLAGKWQQTGVSLADGANDWILTLSEAVFSNRSLQGSGYTARINGAAVPNVGDSAGATVSIVRPDADTIVEYHALKGLVSAILVLQANRDVASLKAVAIMPKTGKATTFILRRVDQAR